VYLNPLLAAKHLLERWMLGFGLLVVHKIMATDPDLTGLKFKSAVLDEQLLSTMFP